LFFAILSFLVTHERHKEKFPRNNRKKKVRPGYETLESSFPLKGKRNTEQLRSVVLFEVRSSAEERACGYKPQSSIPMKRSANKICWEEKEEDHRLLGASAEVSRSLLFIIVFANEPKLGPRTL